MSFIQAWAVKRVAWLLLQWADWISSWLIKLAFSEKSACNRIDSPSQLLKTFVICSTCFLSMYLWTKKLVNGLQGFQIFREQFLLFLIFLLLVLFAIGNTWPVGDYYLEIEKIYQGNFCMPNIDDRYILSLFHHNLLDHQKCHKLMESMKSHKK